MSELKTNLYTSAAFKVNEQGDSQSVFGEKIEMKLSDESLPQTKCEDDNLIFNLDSSMNLSEADSETSKEIELSSTFDFFLEGERLVSSLCGPKIDDKTVDGSECDKGFGEPQESYQFGSSRRVTDNKFEPYSKFASSVALMSPREDESLFKKILGSTEKFHTLKLLSNTETEDKTTENNSYSIRKNIDSEGGKSTSYSGLCPISNKDEFKAKHFSRNWGLVQRRPLSDMRRSDNGSNYIKKIERSSPFKMNGMELKSPLQFALGSAKNRNDSFAIAPGISTEADRAGAETTTESSSKDSDLYFADVSKIDGSRTSEGEYGDQTKICDDEISFRKSAIKGSLVFEQIIRDFQLKFRECDLESYCKNVKRCVSISNSLESDRALVVMTELVVCSLKLADSWSTLNSYFGANGNDMYKPKSEDDCRLYKIFKEWQVSSKLILDCLIVVIQNLKSSISKVEKNTNSSLDLGTPNTTPEYNSFFSCSQQNFKKIEPLFSFTQTDGEKKDSASTKQSQQGSLQLENPITSSLNVFNRSTSRPSSLMGKNKDPSDILLEIQQTAQSLVNKQPTEDKKPRKKWTLTSSDAVSKKINTAKFTPGQGLNFLAQTQIEQSLPLNNPFYALTMPPQMNKSIFEGVPLQSMNFMTNQFGVASQSTNSSIPQLNFMSQQPGMNLNFKQPTQNKEVSSMFKTDDTLNKELTGQGSGGAIFNQASGLNRTNICSNQQQMNFMPFQTNFTSQPFNFLNDQKNKLVYRTNFYFPDGKVMPIQPPLPQQGSAQQPSSTSFFYPPFCSSEMYQSDVFNNQYIQDKRSKTLVVDTDGDDCTETYSQIKSYMKPGSYKVPSKCTFSSILPRDNLNYIFEDIAVTGITVPLTKTESFSPSKKTSVKSGGTVKKNPQKSSEQKDSAWRAAVASAEELSKLVETLKNQSNLVSDKSNSEESGQGASSSKANTTESSSGSNSELSKSNSEESGPGASSSKANTTESSSGLNSENDSKQSDSSKSE